MKLFSLSTSLTIVILRIIMGFIFITHGAARLYYSSIEGFGDFLNSKGLVIGLILAWAITIGEIVFGSLLILGRYVRYCVMFHSVVILTGIIMVHIPNGWFVVGHGTGGVEYSLLILGVLAVLYSYYPNSRFKIGL
jgi:putative oxidoreductase